MITKFAAIAGVLVCAISLHGQAQEYITNGDFEGGPAIPGWNVIQGDGNVGVVGSPEVSPFGDSSASAKFVDGPDLGLGPALSQTFAPAPGEVNLSFDFKISAFTGDFWTVLPGTMQTNGTSYLVNFQLGEAGDFVLGDNGQTFDNSPETPYAVPLVADLWYHVESTFDLPENTWSGSIIAFGGDTSSWTNRYTFGLHDFLNSVSIQDSSEVPEKNGDLYITNFSVTTATPVPESATTAFVGAAAIVLLVIARRHWIARGRAIC